MKVKISKTIDMNQIPNETRKMLDQIKNNLVYGLPEKMNQITMCSLSSRAEEFFQTIDEIDGFRQDLASFDQLLQEVQNILTGYKEAVMPSTEPEETEQSPEWSSDDEAQYEKLMSQMDGADEVEDEEG